MKDRTVTNQTSVSTTMESDHTRVWFVAGAALSFSILGALSRAPGIGAIANYSGIVAGICFALFYVLLNIKNARVRLAELACFSALVLAVPVALLQAQGPFDVAGNFIRAFFLILAVIFWRVRDIDTEQLIPQLNRAFWKVAVITTIFIIAMRAGGVRLSGDHHVPALIFLFAVALSRGRALPIVVVLMMAVVSGKEATYLAILGIVVAFAILSGWWKSGTLLFVIFLIFALSPANPVILGLIALGGNFTRLAEFLSLLALGQFDDDLLTLISSNRYLEYQSVFQNWADNGIPFFGRGLGATVLVELGWANEFVERSTLHNSFMVIFHTTGLIGLTFVAHYVFVPLWRLRKSAPEIVLLMVGYIIYAFFSNTLLQAPSLVFSLALAKRLSEIQATARKSRA